MAFGRGRPMTSLGASAGWGSVVAASLTMGALVASRIAMPERVAVRLLRSARRTERPAAEV